MLKGKVYKRSKGFLENYWVLKWKKVNLGVDTVDSQEEVRIITMNKPNIHVVSVIAVMVINPRRGWMKMLKKYLVNKKKLIKIVRMRMRAIKMIIWMRIIKKKNQMIISHMGRKLSRINRNHSQFKANLNQTTIRLTKVKMNTSSIKARQLSIVVIIDRVLNL